MSTANPPRHVLAAMFAGARNELGEEQLRAGLRFMDLAVPLYCVCTLETESVWHSPVVLCYLFYVSRRLLLEGPRWKEIGPDHEEKSHLQNESNHSLSS